MWPQGIRKHDLPVALWPRDVASSMELGKWYGHNTDKREE
ncbi:MAG: hypothetical protein ACOC9B_01775 [Chloroflexota bacterium]